MAIPDRWGATVPVLQRTVSRCARATARVSPPRRAVLCIAASKCVCSRVFALGKAGRRWNNVYQSSGLSHALFA